MKLVCMNCKEMFPIEHLYGGCPNCLNRDPDKYAKIGLVSSGLGYTKLSPYAKEMLERNLSAVTVTPRKILFHKSRK